MNRQEKQIIINSMRKSFSDSQASFIVGVQGLTVNQLQILRKKIRQTGGSVNVVKNTLLKKAVGDIKSGVHELVPHFEKQIAIVFAPQDFTIVARAIYDVSKEYENLKILAGCYNNAVVSAEKVNYFATLPSHEQLIINHIVLLKAVLVRFVLVIKQASEKGQQENTEQVEQVV